MFDDTGRRSLLAAAVGAVTSLAGCSSGSSSESATTSPSTAESTTESPERTATTDPTPTETEAGVELDGSVPSSPVRAGESVAVEVTVTNHGTAAEVALTGRFGDETAFTESVEVPGGDSVTATFETPPLDRYGSVEVSVNEVRIGTVEFTHPQEIHVTTDGNDDYPGTESAPVATIQEGVDRARPGETVRVHAGEYLGPVLTRRSGDPDAPITITGPTDAILRGNPDDWRGVVEIHHSHVHLDGLTIDGLLDPNAPKEADSYVDKALVGVSPPSRSDPSETTDEYLTDVVVKPDRIGNTQRNMIIVWRTEDVEVGEFEVIGPAGAGWVFNDREEHVGEIIYLGQAPANIVGKDFDWYPWDRYDATSDVHVHHVDNSAGHPHADLVDCKLGTHDVTIEYCTDAGGSQNNETYIPSSITLRGHDATVRWNRLADGEGHAIEIRDQRGYSGQRIEGEPQELVEKAGAGNDVYGNEISGFGGEALTLPEWLDGEPREQGNVCGNDVTGETDFDPEQSCSDAVPEGDGIGHLGGDSPWA